MNLEFLMDVDAEQLHPPPPLPVRPNDFLNFG